MSNVGVKAPKMYKIPIMTKTYAQILVSIVTLLSITAVAADVDPRLDSGPTAVVVEVVDGDTVILDDGSQVRLVGIQTPKLPLGRVGFVEQPLAPDAKAALESLVLDRHGDTRPSTARARTGMAAGWPISTAMTDCGFKAGWSIWRWRVSTAFPTTAHLLPTCWLREEAARRLDAGIWALPFYQVRNARTA